MRRTIAAAIAVLGALAVVSAVAQTPTGNGPPAWNMGYRIDLGLWHGLKLDTSDNLYVNCVAGCSGGGGGGSGGTVTQGSQGQSSSPWYVQQTGALPAGTNVLGGVTQSGGWTVSLGAGSAQLGSVNVSNFPGNPAQETGGNLAAIASSVAAGATAANQATGNTSLATIATNTATHSIGATGSAGDVSGFTTGGIAQILFSGATPANGFALYNPNASDDCWASDSTTAAANGAGSVRLVANGGGYETPTAYKPAGAVSLWCPTTGDKMTARKW